MSTPFNDTWCLGETWTLIVDCRDADGEAIAVVGARWRLASRSAAVLTLDETDGIGIDGSVCTIAVPVERQEDLTSALYFHELQVTDAEGAVSRQAHGTLYLSESLFRRFA